MRDLRAPSSVRIPVTNVDRRSLSRHGQVKYTSQYKEILEQCQRYSGYSREGSDVNGDSCGDGGDDLFLMIRYDLYLVGPPVQKYRV